MKRIYTCKEHKIEFKTKEAQQYHIREIHFNMQAREIEKEEWKNKTTMRFA